MPAGARKARRPSTSPTSPRSAAMRARRRRSAAGCRSRRAPCSSRCHRHRSRKTCTSCSGRRAPRPSGKRASPSNRAAVRAWRARSGIGRPFPATDMRARLSPGSRNGITKKSEPPLPRAAFVPCHDHRVCTRSRTRAMPSASATTVAGMCAWAVASSGKGGAPHRMPERGPASQQPQGLSPPEGQTPAPRATRRVRRGVEAGRHTAARVGHAGDACPEGSRKR